MGTQQILLIVLSVIIVGVAIVVGISMFNRQAYNANATAIASDAQTFATEVVQYFKTPVSQGGAMNTNGDPDTGQVDDDGESLGDGAWSDEGIQTRLFGAEGIHKNENGEYEVKKTSDDLIVEITGTGTAVRGGNSPQIITTITFPEGSIKSVANNVPVGE